ncbi:glucose 1-dehydrogenase [Paracoccus salipaludis]|uniref:3-oxoacyl-ACP reductase n=1 Tax=Paracoccus salipaludis TaxID=2032623 RepID=A0A2A2GNA5_9RHOB|nr:glucose 1-dehydrogenase [Paracoccus salipaludis]PAU98447.1 3-oxoacyl-ACP reductase [Paracoccus salipaludis]
MAGQAGRLEGKVAIVTGAGGGFGEGIAKLFAQEGARVGVLDLRGDAAGKVAAGIGANAVALTADVTSREQMEKAVQTVADRFGVPDIFVNNAGWTHRNKPMLEVTEEEFDRVYAINVKSIYIMSNIIVPMMRRKGGGSIVNIGSVAGIRPRPGLTWYNSTKGAVNILSQSMAAELAPDNIRVNAICPVMGETGLLEAFMGVPDTPENRARFVATIPMGRMSRPEDIARATLYLASDDAEFITGVLLPVDGGRTI